MERSFHHIDLVVLPSPYRSLLQPLLTFIGLDRKENPDEKVTVIIGEFASDKWWHPLLHGNSGLLPQGGAFDQTRSRCDKRAFQHQTKAA